MVELYSQFRTKIDFKLFKSDWVRPTGYNFTFDDKLTLINNNQWAEYYAYTNMLEIGKKYRIKYKLKDFTSSWLRFVCGNTGGGYRITNGEYEEVLTCAGSKNFGIKWYSTCNATIYDVEIEEVGFTRLDTNEDTDIQLNLCVNDIREVNEKRSNYSNEFLLPGTPNNNRFFKYVFDVNNKNIFNIKAKTFSNIVVDEIEYKTGYIKLEKIIRKNNIVNYEIVFYGETANLFADTKDKYLKDLDFCDINHTVTAASVVSNWAATTPNYRFPYINYGYKPLRGTVGSALDNSTVVYGQTIPAGLGLVVADLFPSISLKYLIDKIFTTYGYTYESDLFNKDWFKEIYLPFVNDEEILNDWYKVGDLYFGGQECIGKFFGINYLLTALYVDLTTGKYVSATDIHAATDGIPSRLYNLNGYNVYPLLDSSLYLRLNPNETLIINNTLYGGLGSINIPHPQYMNNIIPGCYVTRKAGMHRIEIKFKLNTPSGWSYYIYQNPVKLFITRIPRSSVEFTLLNGTHSRYKVNSENCELIETYYTPTNQYVTVTKDIYCDKDENIAFKFVHDYGTGEPWSGNISYIRWYESGYGNGVALNFKNVVPQEMKINDFISSLMKLFNLYIEETNTYKQLNIQTFDDYYTSGNTYDYTYKIDRDSETEIEFPSDYFTNKLILKYTKGSDTWNEYWSDKKDYLNTPMNYGGKLINIDNEFSEDVSEIENDFSSTVLRSWLVGDTINNATKYTYSSIENFDYKENGVAREQKTKTEPRLLFWNKLNIYDNSTSATTFRFENNSYLYYPYMGHILNPYNMNASGELLDLNYDTLLINDEKSWSLMFVGNPIGYVTKKNLYNVYWKQYIDNFVTKDSRIMRSKFHLTKDDVIKLKMNDKIIVDDTTYIINKIDNLDMECKNLIEIELLKVNDISITYDSGQTSSYGVGKTPFIQNDNFILGNNNTVSTRSTGQVVIGDNNIVNNEKGSGLITGSGNFSKDNSVVFGDNNISNVKSTIMGDNNTIITGGTGAIVIGTSTRDIKTNEIVIGNKTSDGDDNDGVNDGGEDVVGIEFENQIVNDAGENKLWDLNYIDNDVVEDGGEN